MPHWSVARHVRFSTPVPMQPFIWLLLSWYVRVIAVLEQLVLAIADPVFPGEGMVLHEIVTVVGQVIVTCPNDKAKGARASHIAMAIPL